MLRRLAAALALMLLTLPATAGPLSSADRAKLLDAFRRYVREADTKKRDALWKPVDKLASSLAPADLESLIREAVPGDDWKGGFIDGIEFASAGETWTCSAILPGKRPKGLVPLVLDVGHGSWAGNDAKQREEGMRNWLRAAGCAEQVIYLRTRVIDTLSTDGRYDAWSAPPRRALGGPNLDTIAGIVLDAVRDASLRWPVDPDRVYVQGISQTGFWTWWLAQAAPDRWAAVAPVGAVTFHVRRLAANLVPVPVFILHGTKDPTCPFVQAKDMADDLTKLGAKVDFRPTEGGGHMEGVFPRFAEIWPAAMACVRNPYPAKFERRYVTGARPDAFWLRALGVDAKEFNPFAPPARVAGAIDGQTLAVEASGCAEVEVLVASRMLDVTKPVTITMNGKSAWKGTVKPTPRAALDVARERGDGGAAFAAVISVNVQ